MPDSLEGRLDLLMEQLRARRVLLVLDNFEHVLEGAGLVADMLAAAPRVKVLVTSRERLNLNDEVMYPLGGMAVPERASDQQALE
jgi:predicted ATPase